LAYCLITESDLFDYYGKFTISDRQFSDKLTDISSSLYTGMSAEVADVVSVYWNVYRLLECI